MVHDSDLNVLLFTDLQDVHEELLAIECKQTNTLIDSHHDVLISSVSLPYSPFRATDSSENIIAPKLANTRRRVVWSDDGINEYRNITRPVY